MTRDTDFPSIESHLPEVMDFVSGLTQDYQLGNIGSWEIMAEKVHAFFTHDMLDTMDAIAPGWRAMSSYGNGVTLVHVMCVFVALQLSPEFHGMSTNQQGLMKWIVFFHDIAKEVHQGQRDFTHGFRSAAITGATLPDLGFAVTAEYDSLIEEWTALTNTASTRRGKTSVYVQDNHRLPVIVEGIERMFGRHTPATLIVKAVLFHMSIDVLKEWPQAAPLTETEVGQYLDTELIPLLKAMMLVDNDGWAFFNQPTKARHRQETLTVFRKLEHDLSHFH